MSWFKVDDSMYLHPKVRKAGNSAMGLWVRSGSWCMQHLTDGFIDRATARQFGSAADITRLVEVGLWEPTTGGYQFHEFLGVYRNRSKEQVMEAREANAERQRKFRDRNAVTNADPDQTREVQVQKTAVVDLDSRRSAGRE